jgi:hypothetical protein
VQEQAVASSEPSERDALLGDDQPSHYDARMDDPRARLLYAQQRLDESNNRLDNSSRLAAETGTFFVWNIVTKRKGLRSGF